jgi:hypothetical protein
MSEQLAEHQKALLLLHLLVAKGRRMKKGDANRKLTGALKKNLALSITAANQLRETLVGEKFIKKSLEKIGSRKAEYYELTDRGLALLGSLEQYPPGIFRIKGSELNALISAVREQRETWQEADKEARPTTTVSGHLPSNLAETILAEFTYLRKERFGHTGLVPICEVRKRIAEKYGSDAARHDVFDPHVHLLRQQHRIRMVPISDLRDASEQQLNDSIPGVNETLFYLEPAHAQLAV